MDTKPIEPSSTSRKSREVASAALPEDIWRDIGRYLDLQDRACLSEVDGNLSRLFRWDRLRLNDLLKLQVLRVVSFRRQGSDIDAGSLQKELERHVNTANRAVFMSTKRYLLCEPRSGPPDHYALQLQSLLLIDRMLRREVPKTWRFASDFGRWVADRLCRVSFDTFDKMDVVVSPELQISPQPTLASLERSEKIAFADVVGVLDSVSRSRSHDFIYRLCSMPFETTRSHVVLYVVGYFVLPRTRSVEAAS